MAANTKGYHVTVLPISGPLSQAPSLEANGIIHFLCVLFRDALCIYNLNMRIILLSFLHNSVVLEQCSMSWPCH